MAENARLIDELAEAVIDGTPVDWAAAAADVPSGRLVAHLRVIAAVAEVHRTSPLPTEGPSSRAIPDSWGHLRILERIGRGAFGDVYRAWDSRLDREVALKLIPAAPQLDEGLAPSVIREGRLLAKVRHANVAVIHGAEQIGDRIGLWMELVHGRTLEQSLRAGNAFTIDQVIRIGVELASAVAAVHAAGLLHRDIKTQNVMQSDDGRIVLMDFGTGREFVDEGTDLAGTPLFLAPEVLAGQQAGVHSDIYSLGVVLYHLLTDSYPVRGRTVAEIRRAHDENDRIDLHVARPDVPARLARVIQKAIDPVPGRRYLSADALRRDLDKLVRRSRGRWLGYVAAAALGIALVPMARGFIVSERALSTTVLPVGQSPVIAVLPFQNLDSEPDHQLVADGFTSEIAHRLGAIEGLSVRLAGVSFAARGASVDVGAVGRELNVNLVLTGSVLVADGRVRVGADLIRVSDHAIVWSDTINHAGGPAVAAHDAISLAIVNRLRLTVGQGQRRYTPGAEVELMFLTAQGLMARRHTDNARLAVVLFEKIIKQEPEFAPAWAELASALAAEYRARPSERMPERDPKMDEAVREAERLDPFRAETQSALGSLHARDREWEAAEAAFRAALKLNPNLTTTYTEYVLWVLQPMGRHAEALSLLEQARAVEPRSLDVRRVMALVQVDSGLYDDAIESARWVLEQDAEFPFAELWLGRALALSGRALPLPDRLNEAQTIFEKNQNWFGYLGYLYATTNRRKEAEALADEHLDSPSRVMLIYGGLGDKDRAFEALKKVVDLHWWRAACWIYRPEMALLRGDPRVDALKTRLGLPR